MSRAVRATGPASGRCRARAEIRPAIRTGPSSNGPPQCATPAPARCEAAAQAMPNRRGPDPLGQVSAPAALWSDRRIDGCAEQAHRAQHPPPAGLRHPARCCRHLQHFAAPAGDATAIHLRQRQPASSAAPLSVPNRRPRAEAPAPPRTAEWHPHYGASVEPLVRQHQVRRQR